MENRKQIEILNVEHLLDAKYVIPLYQRNFAWGEEQIIRLLRDIYESMKSEEEQYFVGSLVVIQRKGGEYEVIDGQQRLTILSLLSIVLHLDVKTNIHYDSRPEVERFFEQITTGLPISQRDSSISHFLNAKETIQEGIKVLESEFNSNDFWEKYSAFIRDHVCVVRDVMPQDTDVASYFEIMNNRGEQLQEHEIVKGLLLDKLQKNPQLCQLCSMIWDSCSQMDERIQRSFPKPVRIALFGENYDDLIPNSNNFKTVFENINLDNTITEGVCLENIIKPDFQYTALETSTDNFEDKPEKYNEESIIDFPNFLMHVFKLYYETDCGDQETNVIPLHDKHLLKIYRLIQGNIDPIEFIYQLLRCRTIFDRYVVKTNYVNDDNEENREWSLRYPKKYAYNERTQLRFDNTFKKEYQDTIVKALSCIQVSHPSRYYKNYLQTILGWFKGRDSIIMDGKEYLHELNNYIYDELKEKCTCYFGLKEYDEKLQGTNVSHIALDYIDYLLWLMHIQGMEQNGEEKEWSLLKRIKDFRFQYWNSVEHHYPQKRKEEFTGENVSDYYLNCLGNLFLIGKSTNSRLSDKNPKDKAILYDSNDVNLAPNRQLIYTITIEKDWDLAAIQQHLSFIEKVYEKASTILYKN